MSVGYILEPYTISVCVLTCMHDASAAVVMQMYITADYGFRVHGGQVQHVFLQYVQDKSNCFGQSKKLSINILHQAMKGMTYLHSIGIGVFAAFKHDVNDLYMYDKGIYFHNYYYPLAVHRDIKPRNVLLSNEGLNGSFRVMISDFGLCKKLTIGKVSFTARSGLTGTEGWIAPEILQKNERVVGIKIQHTIAT